MVYRLGERWGRVERKRLAVAAEDAEPLNLCRAFGFDLAADRIGKGMEGTVSILRRLAEEAGNLLNKIVGHDAGRGSGGSGFRGGLEGDAVGRRVEDAATGLFDDTARLVLRKETTEAGHGDGIALHQALSESGGKGALHVLR